MQDDRAYKRAEPANVIRFPSVNQSSSLVLSEKYEFLFAFCISLSQDSYQNKVPHSLVAYNHKQELQL